jgi:hypothetical protein
MRTKGKKVHSTSILLIIVLALSWYYGLEKYQFYVLMGYMALRDMAFRDALSTLEKRIK